ncbi:mycofactocin-coupled SDR family oxidoreductase [Nocardioides KLBMP 9356]|uniref:Mycofactocin-coupled SDR family oxidoreductase n=1 Tax=Nocardioides potassii TaxID=2911371 RepID=A0ABS9HCR0_9ACTN|nr:mycofactocin-coupled SDR family oxidoreductase [Nocardioides potassii]MCF6378133.1 mycofactocin-coupled SDR family oxidoreductase [Nocardioides potassii]
MNATERDPRVVLVTGAGRGIGAATTRRLAGRGERVIAVDWCVGTDTAVPYPMPRREELESLARPNQVLTLVADVRDREALARGVELALSTWGRLDAAVAAAAVIAGGSPLWLTATADLEMLWQVDVLGVWNTAAVSVPAMLSGPDPAGCRFVALTSAAASHGLYGLSAYNVVKHAVAGLVRGLSADLADSGPTAVAVSPGSTRTAMLDATARLYDMPDLDGFAGRQRLGRLLSADEIAAVVDFCTTREAASLNGSEVHAEGGFLP